MDSTLSRLSAAAEIAVRLRSQVLDGLKREYVGKDEVIDLLGICLAAGENLFLLGPPGTAKSALVRSLSARLDGRVFDYLLTRFTEPSELFGPFDIRRLRDGELLTNTDGMLPEADVIFLDELLNANSAILNSLLMALNERVFRRGRETRPLDFVLTVGASNRLPEDEALNALFDRFLLRVFSDNVPAEMLAGVLEAGWQLQQTNSAPEASSKMSVAELRELQKCIPLVRVDLIRTQYVGLINRLRHSGIDVSDRRAVRLQRLAAASALMCGRTEVRLSDLWVLKYIWDTREQVQVLAKIVDDAIADDAAKPDSADTKSHPRSHGSDAPDPEHIARDLDQIEFELAKEADEAAHKSWLKDRLSLLAARVEWVRVAESRSFLKERIQNLLNGKKSVP